MRLGTALLMQKYPDHGFIQDDLESTPGTAKREKGVESILADLGCRQWHKTFEAENFPHVRHLQKTYPGPIVLQ